MKKFYIKERHNPQLGIYHIPCGQMSAKDAKATESNSLYGFNVMLGFKNRKDYDEALDRFRKAGSLR